MSNHGLVQQGTAASADMVNVLLPRNTQTTHKIGVSFPKRFIASDICDFTQSYNKKIYYCPVKPRNTKHNRVWSSSIFFMVLSNSPQNHRLTNVSFISPWQRHLSFHLSKRFIIGNHWSRLFFWHILQVSMDLILGVRVHRRWLSYSSVSHSKRTLGNIMLFHESAYRAKKCPSKRGSKWIR